MENTINLNEKTVTELKAIAYDLLASIEQMQSNLRQVNQVISEKLKEFTPTEEVK